MAEHFRKNEYQWVDSDDTMIVHIKTGNRIPFGPHNNIIDDFDFAINYIKFSDDPDLVIIRLNTIRRFKI